LVVAIAAPPEIVCPHFSGALRTACRRSRRRPDARARYDARMLGFADPQRRLRRRGVVFVAWIAGWLRLLRFGGATIVAALSPSVYNPATRAVVARQIYFTAWQVIPGFVLFVAVLSAVLVRIVDATAREYGLSQFATELTMRVLLLEVIPLTAALFVSLRSGAAINTEVALMSLRNEIEALARAGVDPMRFEFVPRLVGVYGFFLWGVPEFTRSVGNVFDAQITIGLGLKCLFFGLAVGIIPMAEGLGGSREVHTAPVTVLRGMMRLFFVLVLIEVTSLAFKYT
jgi:phospholipid/cholesterol/gamma-HCH transport system permease protein